MKVARYNYASQFTNISILTARVVDALVTGNYILGDTVREFESSFAGYTGSRNAIGMNSGTDALILTLDALGIGPGDEVIIPANTFYATALAVSRVGATPILVDCDSQLQIDVGAVESAIGDRTRAIIAVHLFGCLCNIEELADLASRRNIALVEDCAQAVGARRGGKMCGTFGIAGCFSFHPSKNLAAAGDAGAVITDDDQLADRLRVLRNLGQREQNEHLVRGYNSKLDEIQAMVLLDKLPHLDKWNSERIRIATIYQGLLGNMFRIAPKVVTDGTHVYHLFPVFVPERDSVLAHLVKGGVEAIVRYPQPIHQQSAFADLGYAPSRFPHAVAHANNTICLPMRPDLSDGEIAHVVELLISTVTSITGVTPKAHASTEGGA